MHWLKVFNLEIYRYSVGENYASARSSINPRPNASGGCASGTTPHGHGLLPVWIVYFPIGGNQALDHSRLPNGGQLSQYQWNIAVPRSLKPTSQAKQQHRLADGRTAQIRPSASPALVLLARNWRKAWADGLEHIPGYMLAHSAGLISEVSIPDRKPMGVHALELEARLPQVAIFTLALALLEHFQRQRYAIR